MNIEKLEDKKYLFTADSLTAADVSDGSKKLVEQFAKKKIELNKDFLVTKKDTNQWNVRDGDNEYVIKKIDGKFYVYEVLGYVKEFETGVDISKQNFYNTRLAKTLKALIDGDIPNDDYTKDDLKVLCLSLVNGQRYDLPGFDGSWAIFSTPEQDPNIIDIGMGMETDAWVDYVGEPTYLVMSILTYMMYEYPDIVKEIDDFEKVLKAGYDFSTYRGYVGHGFGGEYDMLTNLDMFQKSHVLKHLGDNIDFSPKANITFKHLLNYMETKLLFGLVKSDYNDFSYKQYYLRSIGYLKEHGFHKEELVREFKPLNNNEDDRPINEELEYTLKVLIDGEIPNDDYTKDDLEKLCASLVKEQRYDLVGFEGSWAIFPHKENLPLTRDTDADLPVDAWVYFTGRPTNTVLSILTYVFYQYPKISDKIDGFEEALKKGFEAAAKRDKFGWNISDLRSTVTIDLLDRSHFIRYIMENPENARKAYDTIRKISEGIFEVGTTKYGNPKRTHKKILKILERNGLGPES